MVVQGSVVKLDSGVCRFNQWSKNNEEVHDVEEDSVIMVNSEIVVDSNQMVVSVL